jgi:hypothetical protein
MNRRGVAILLVLVVLVVAVTAAVNVARVSVAGMTAHRLAADTRLADDLLNQAEIAAHTWLGSVSSTVVLPPDTDRPSLMVFDDVVVLGDHSCSMTVTAVDLLGMPGLHNAGAFGVSLPIEVADAIGALDEDADGIGPDMIDRASVDGPVYPVPRRGDPVIYGDAMSGGRSRSIDQQTTAEAELNGLTSVCELVAFVGISPPRRVAREQADEQPDPINVNTATIPLLESVLSQSGLDAIDGIIEARTEGEPATLNITLDDDSPIRLVTRSTLWGFRCDVRTGTVSKSHWIVFEQAGGAWRLVRRIVIDA